MVFRLTGERKALASERRDRSAFFSERSGTD